jgi:hypothetical protein
MPKTDGEIKIFNKFGELVRTYTEEQSDEEMDYKEKASIFAEKNGYSIGEPPAVLADPTAPTDPELLGSSEEVAKPKGKGKGKK